MTTSSFLPMILLAVFAVGAALVAGYLILRSGPKEKPASNQRPPNQPTGEWLNREGRPISRRNTDLSWKKFGSASMILVGTFSTGAIVAIFVGAIVVYGGLLSS